MKRNVPLNFKYELPSSATILLPIDEKAKKANELKVIQALTPHLQKLNKENCLVLVIVAEDGKTFQNELVGCDQEIFLN